MKHSLVPHSQWGYFNNHLALLEELQEYIKQFGNDGYMPLLTEIQANGYHKLSDRIKWFGGAKLLASRMDMKLTRGNSKITQYPNQVESSLVELGPFDLNFAVDLLRYIKQQSYVRKLGEISNAVYRNDALKSWDSYITMPFRQDLIQHGKSALILKIEEFGGFECVARRLQLPYDDRNLKEVKRAHINTAIQQISLKHSFK